MKDFHCFFSSLKHSMIAHTSFPKFTEDAEDSDEDKGLLSQHWNSENAKTILITLLLVFQNPM